MFQYELMSAKTRTFVDRCINMGYEERKENQLIAGSIT
jgi:hypothetical protein